jgi:hypothetical protein
MLLTPFFLELLHVILTFPVSACDVNLNLAMFLAEELSFAF